MKKGIITFVGGIIVGIAATFFSILFILPGQMFLVNESRLGFDQTMEEIIESAEANQWTISHIYDLQATMKKKGFEVAPVNVISLCNPGHAHNILSSDEDRVVSALMPCRVAVYEKDGKTYISMLNSGLFSRFLSDNAKETIKAAGEETLQILKPVI